MVMKMTVVVYTLSEEEAVEEGMWLHENGSPITSQEETEACTQDEEG